MWDKRENEREEKSWFRRVYERTADFKIRQNLFDPEIATHAALPR